MIDYGIINFEFETVNCKLPSQKQNTNINLINFEELFNLTSSPYMLPIKTIHDKELRFDTLEYRNNHNRIIYILNCKEKFLFFDKQRFALLQKIILYIGTNNFYKYKFKITKNNIEYFLDEKLILINDRNKILTMLNNNFYTIKEYKESDEYKKLTIFEDIIK